MKKQSIKSHLAPYSIAKKRTTTINHAFASGVAPNDEYDKKIIDSALKTLKQNPDKNLSCAYCGSPAETWDHVFGLVKDYRYYGFGHVIGNLLPCCKNCNSEKGNKNWREFLNTKIRNKQKRGRIISILENYFKKYLPSKYGYEDIAKLCSSEIMQYEKLRKRVITTLEEADTIAKVIREKILKIR